MPPPCDQIVRVVGVMQLAKDYNISRNRDLWGPLKEEPPSGVQGANQRNHGSFVREQQGQFVRVTCLPCKWHPVLCTSP